MFTTYKQAIARYAVPLAVLIIVSYQFRPASHELKGVAVLGNSLLGIVAAVGFLVGAVCSAIAGYVSMWVAARSNIRVASAARRSYGEALVICFRGGAFSAVLNLTLCVAGELDRAVGAVHIIDIHVTNMPPSITTIFQVSLRST